MRKIRAFVSLSMQAGIPQSCRAGVTTVKVNNSTRGKAMGAVVINNSKICATRVVWSL